MNQELTIAEIARHYGQWIRCKSYYDDRTIIYLLVDTETLAMLANDKSDFADIRLILKPLDSLTEEDAAEVLKRADILRSHGYTALEHFNDHDEWYAPQIEQHLGNSKVRYALLDLGYDVDGLIERGLAIDTTKEGV